ncbi:response regulator transcription factor [Anaeromicropila herbilytica]|uniref:Stage 0 sporulation protein A homolog n=1 Tax=Anaeromicropila herbilytica TaxID=2785025 RepID=A0A7R7EM04_9FIRM|nr:response regulator [Anaeromicropila herbilytica]BCN31299.1 DNA-binding response regulator [Anaeromicropila herbilytica]
MMKVFIADDEINVRQGLKNIIDWKELGFDICGEAGNGVACLEGIMKENPDLVLLDIQMPKMQGIQVAKHAREQGYKGKIIILSGYSDFEYAKSAIPYGIDYYLLKPIDEDELTNAVTNVYRLIMKDKQEKGLAQQYFIKARGSILRDIILGRQNQAVLEDADKNLELKHLDLNRSCYRVLLIEQLSSNVEHLFGENDIQSLFHLYNNDLSDLEHVVIDNTNVLLIKGETLIHRISRVIESFEVMENATRGMSFIVAGKIVTNLNEIHNSYKTCRMIMDRKFFTPKDHFVIEESNYQLEKDMAYDVTEIESSKYHDMLYKNIESYNRAGIKETLQILNQNLMQSYHSEDSIKNFITGIFLHIKHDVKHDYKKCDIQLDSNTDIIATIQKMNFLYEIIHYVEDQMVQIIKAIGNSTCESILSDILHYIDLNFRKNLKLETIAAVFGYNSAYLGKVFTKNMGVNFNSYVDKVRINYAKELVLEDRLKVYEIAENVGYKNLDYFHRKFKRYVGYSPAEYRKLMKDNDE